MELALKNEIREAAIRYMNEKKLSQDDLALKSGLNGSYLSSIVNGKWEMVSAGNKPVQIQDKWFVMLADIVGVRVNKLFWQTVMTKQMQVIIDGLTTAKETGRTTTLICNTGMGKTYAVEKFIHENPKHTYLITISSLLKLHDVVNILLRLLGLPEKGSKAMRMISIIMKLREIKRNGGKALLIFDEGENMELSLIKMMKGLYDGLSGYASIAVIGTDQLQAKMLSLKNSNRDAGPQYYRRFKAGVRIVNSVPNFEPFFDLFVPEKGLQKLLNNICDNYGELHDYLEPALREADARGVELTEMFFRVMYDMAA